MQRSCESAFYSDADWVRLRLEMFHLNALITGRRQLTPSACSAVQTGLNELLLDPSVKRRAGIEFKRAVDDDAMAADEQIGRYKTVLRSI